MTTTTATIRTPEAELHYRRRARPGAPTLLLLHGITDGGAVWTRVADELADRFDLVMPDARGHGRSSRVPDGVGVPAFARDAAALIEQLELAPVLVWGHSMGAATAAELAATRPELVRAVILEDPPFVDGVLAPADADDARAAGFRQLLGSMAALPAEERLALAGRVNPQWHAAELLPWADTKAEFDVTALAMMSDGIGIDWRATAAAVRCPALLVTGDPVLGGLVTPETATAAADLIAGLEVAAIAGAGHNIHRDRFDETLAAATAFLDGVRASL